MAPTIISITLEDSTDVTDLVLKQGHGVKALSEMGLKSIPQQYIQPLEERLLISKIIMPQQHQQQQQSMIIPIIDMSQLVDGHDDDDDQVLMVANSICDAAEKWGFFQVVNHGVPLQVLKNVKKATHGFFGMPPEEKRKYSKENSPSNNVRLTTSFIPQVEKALEWKDYLSLFYVSDDEAEALWPPICKDQVLEYMKSSKTLSNRLVQVLMKRLNVHEIDETKQSLLMGSLRANLNYYPICPNPELTVGVGRHSDVSTFTILLQDDVGGLYVRGMDAGGGGGDGWIHIPPIDGALVINIGDALQIMSNGRYKSAEHRVAANGTKNRISVPLFINPRPQDIIGPLPEVLAREEKPIYKQVLYSDYVKHFYRKAHDGKKTIEFAKITQN
ncbi:hypothetical protein ACOSQ3_017747 [Xanthoceras sorbifolium]